MKALILAAGYGKRFYPITNHKPKALLTIRSKPIVEYIISKIEKIKEVEEIIIVTNHHYMKEFQHWLENYPAILPIRLIDDGSVNGCDKRGSVGDMAFAIKQSKIKDDLLVVGGDNLFSFSLNNFIESARNLHNCVLIGTFNLNGRLQPDKFGLVNLDEHKKIINFQEKPDSCTGSSLVSICLYFFPADKLPLIDEYLSQHNNPDESGNYISWLSQRDTVYGYTFNEGNWFDIGDIDAYTEAVFTF